MTIHPSFSLRDNDTIIKVIVKPRSPKLSISIDTESVVIQLTKPADKNKANKELISFLSKLLGISSSYISIIAGSKSHNKIIKIASVNVEQAYSKLLKASK